MPIEVMANTTSTATLRSATCSGTGFSSSPKNVVGGPNGITANAANAVVAESTGAR